MAAAAAAVLATIPLTVGAAAAATGTSAAVPAFSASKTISRDHLVSGADQVVDTRHFSVRVDQTSGLRERQEVNVSWSGAHPTGGIVADPNSQLAAEQEYPVVVLECRGTDAPAAPPGQRLAPQTCWTHTPEERYQSNFQFNFPPFRMDRYATPSDRGSAVGVPSPLPQACASSAYGVQHWVHFLAADGTDYPGGENGCAGIPPEAVNLEQSLQPGNTTYAASSLDGTGSANFTIETAETNASLGCSDTVACSLVVIPIMGISCDAAGAAPGVAPQDQPPPDAVQAVAAQCQGTGKYQPGQVSSGFPFQEDLSVSGDLWWSASNWRNRVTVPLSFAPAPNACALSNPSPPLYLYGSELMAQATSQWAPAFCLDKTKFKFDHVQTAEPEAKNLLASGSIEAAIQGAPPDQAFTAPTVQAPIGLTGFAITYAIDDAHGKPYPQLRLTPRLLAKLMTESYPAVPDVRNFDPPLATNPLNMGEDPEFQALNPGVPAPILAEIAAATLYSVSSGSDTIHALTSYIEADPAARAWIDGKPDPWGMVVNPAYKGISLPVSTWPLLDTWENTQSGIYSSSDNPCLAASPVPYLPLVAAPVSTLAQVTLNMQFSVANSQVNCIDPGLQTEKLGALGRETPGQRFLLGVTPLADAQRYRLATAALQTQVSPSAPAKFSDAAGRTFVAPDDASLRAAAALLVADPKLGTWAFPYDKFQTGAAAAAYPGTMLMSADVPTQGLPAADAREYATLLSFAAGPGQTPGYANGQLPPGFLPLTAADGLGPEAAYTLVAAAAVAAQKGGVPPLIPAPVRPPSPPRTTVPIAGGAAGSGIAAFNPPPPPASGTAGAPNAGSGGGGAGQGPVAVTAGGAALPQPSVAPRQPVSQVPIAPAVALGRTPSVGSGVAGLALPLAATLAIAGAAVCVGLGATGRRRS